MAASVVVASVGRSAVIVIVPVITVIGTTIVVIAVIGTRIGAVAIVWPAIIVPVVIISTPAPIGIVAITRMAAAVKMRVTCLRRIAGKEDQNGRKNQTGNKFLH